MSGLVDKKTLQAPGPLKAERGCKCRACRQLRQEGGRSGLNVDIWFGDQHLLSEQMIAAGKTLDVSDTLTDEGAPPFAQVKVVDRETIHVTLRSGGGAEPFKMRRMV